MLMTPVAPKDLLYAVIEPTLDVLPPVMSSDPARIMLLAIAGQESALAHRTQQGGGPAHSFWQFERGGIHGVLTCPSTAAHAARICALHGCAGTVDAVYLTMLVDDGLGCAFARLLLWSHPEPLPVSENAGYAYYEGLWKPGKPDPSRWPRWYRAAVDAVQ